jgi:predicted permease
MSWVSRIFGKRKREEELEEEVRSHLEMAARERAERGENVKEAERAARREFGNVELVKQVARDAWGWRRVEEFVEDVRYGLRTLSKKPGFTTVAVLTLALGIGANTAIFSFVNAVLLRELPVKDPQQLAFPRIIEPKGSGGEFAYGEFEEIRDRSQSFSGVFAFDTTRFLASFNGQTDFVWGQCVSANFYSILGVNPILGREFTEQEDQPGQPATVVISYDYWKRKFALDPSVVGNNVVLKKIPFRIVGVAPPSFRGIELGDSVDIWMPMAYWPQVRLSDHLSVGIMGRLKPDIRDEQSAAELTVLDRDYVARKLEARAIPWHEQPLESRRIELVSGARGLFDLPDELPNELNILMVVVGLVLLIACANVANLLLARAVNRKREIALRLALGAGRMRLTRQLLTESLLLAVAGGGLGFLLAGWMTNLLLRFAITGIDPASLDLRADGRVMLFTAGLSILTGFIFGLAPAFGATRVDPGLALKAAPGAEPGGETRAGLGKGLVVAQVALCAALLVAAGLMVRTLEKLNRVNPGFEQDRILLVSVYPTLGGYEGTRELNLYSRLQEQIEAAPGVLCASFSRFGLLSGGGWGRKIANPGGVGRPEEGIRVHCNPVAPRFFATMGIPLVFGRDFDAGDGAGAAKVAIISEALARAAFPNTRPIGEQIEFVGENGSEQAEVVGIVRDVRSFSMRGPDRSPGIYIPLQQAPADLLGQATMEIRTAGDPAIAIDGVRRTSQAIGPNLPLAGMSTQAAQIAGSLGGERSLTTLLSLFSMLAIALASIGLYGVIAYSVTRRTREIGIRMAIGAGQPEVLRMVLGQGMRLTLVGIGVGLTGAAAASRVLSSKLFGVTSTDPVTFAAVALLLTGVALAACYVPARRAMRADPVVALRYE